MTVARRAFGERTGLSTVLFRVAGTLGILSIAAGHGLVDLAEAF